MKAYRGRRCKTPFILNLGTWRWPFNCTHWPFTPVEKPPLPTEQDAGWIPEPVWMFLSTVKSPVPARNGTWIAQHGAKSLYRLHYHMYTVLILSQILPSRDPAYLAYNANTNVVVRTSQWPFRSTNKTHIFNELIFYATVLITTLTTKKNFSYKSADCILLLFLLPESLCQIHV
jgi:hypothetical protein